VSLATRPPVRQAVLALVAAVALACGREADSDGAMPMVTEAATGERGQDLSGKGIATGMSVRAEAAPTAPPAPLPAQDEVRPGQMLIRNGFASVRVDSLEQAMAAVRQLAASLGGSVGNVSMSSGEFEVRSATLELRVPSERFDEAMGGLAPLGRVEHSSTSVQDVGEEFVDLNARMATSRRLEQRLVELLANRTGRLEDVLAVERELARVRQEIERTEGRLRYLGARVAMSTINVTVSERAPVASQPGRNVIKEAFVGAWRNFVGLVAWLIESLGVIIPVLLVAWLVVRGLRGRRRVAD
jgi:hypothetical protein